MLDHSGARMVATSAAHGDCDFYGGCRERIPTVEHGVFIGNGSTDGSRHYRLNQPRQN